VVPDLDSDPAASACRAASQAQPRGRVQLRSREPARILEIISPAGFERYFEQMVDLLERSAGPPDPSELGTIAAQHGLEVDRESIPRLTAKHGLRWGRRRASAARDCAIAQATKGRDRRMGQRAGMSLELGEPRCGQSATSRDRLPDIFHAAGPSDGGWTVVAVHESKEAGSVPQQHPDAQDAQGVDGAPLPNHTRARSRSTTHSLSCPPPLFRKRSSSNPASLKIVVAGGRLRR
jgi:hypothetical protein